jgi:hypothetical protein
MDERAGRAFIPPGSLTLPSPAKGEEENRVCAVRKRASSPAARSSSELDGIFVGG